MKTPAAQADLGEIELAQKAGRGRGPNVHRLAILEREADAAERAHLEQLEREVG